MAAVLHRMRSAILRGAVIPALALAAPGARATEGAAPLFQDATRESGLAFAHANGAGGKLELLAIMGPGVALLDYDGDGDLDLFLPQGRQLPLSGGKPGGGGGRLLRNDAQVGEDGATATGFVDVTAKSGLVADGYGIGVAVGDFDGDGAPDLLLANLGEDRLWRNRGDGTFADVTPPALRRSSWSIGGTFFDADGDGDLDLYVVDYVEPTPGVKCFAESSRPDYCGPAAYRPLAGRLLRNDGSASATRWADVSVASGVGKVTAPGLGVVVADLDSDGRLDLYVADDGAPNLLWHGRGDGTFAEEGLLSGTALSRDGLPRAGMGVDAGDADGDGDEELFVTNLTGETNTLYVNDGELLFEDRTAEAGLGAPSLPWTGFGTAFVDADLDGRLDLVVVNGAVRLAQGSAAATPLAQPGQLYRNLGGGRFALAPTTEAGEALAAPAVSR
ncbi:MAG TPA: VCBS repeat-containing protein, partial [Thermoanaerobaculia bacterium]|nr:VCBS repeat-containing protein [Thermoanaerobaculia bacterium]